MGGPEDLDNDDDVESLAGRLPESALQGLSLSSPGLTHCVRNDRCHVKPSSVLCFCATGFKVCSAYRPQDPQSYGTSSWKCEHQYYEICIRLLSFNDTL